MRARSAAPAHIGHGSSVTTSAQSSRRQPSRARAASVMASSSACAVGSPASSRSLCRRASTSPSERRTITAPTGTSSCATAARASSSATPITASYSCRCPSTAPLRLLDEVGGLLRRLEQVLEHLPARVVGQLVAELDLGRHLEAREGGADPLAHIVFAERAGGVRHHERSDLLAE